MKTLLTTALITIVLGLGMAPKPAIADTVTVCDGGYCYVYNVVWRYDSACNCWVEGHEFAYKYPDHHTQEN